MTQAAQSALRRVIEQYTRHVRFCIICNYVNRIIPAIQSRCTRFRFGPLDLPEIDRRIGHVVEGEHVDITSDGREALKKLCKGDMRRVLNVLQACHSGYGKVDETAVYECTGQPHPKDIEGIVDSMMNDDFQTAFKRPHLSLRCHSCSHASLAGVNDQKTKNGLALQDIILGIYDLLSTIMLPAPAKIYLLDQLANVEHRLSTGGSEKLQLSSLLGAFKTAVEIGAKHQK